MRYLYLALLLLISTPSFSKEAHWVKTEGTITEITVHPGRRTKESAIVKFNLEDGTEQMGDVELFRIPFLGSMKSVGDKIGISYDSSNPAIVQTVIGKLFTQYGMYILILLGIIFSIKPFLNSRKKIKESAQ